MRPSLHFLRRLLPVAAALLTAAVPTSVPAADAPYPAQPIKLVVPFPPGGPTDIVARPFAEALTRSLGKPVVIENRGGAGGNVGADNVAKANPDGYTLLLGTVGTAAINPALYARLSYDPRKDLAPVAILAAAPVALVAHPSVPANTVGELLALAGRQSLRFGTAGNGTPGHLTGEMFKQASAAPLTHVPYKGSAAALQDLLGGHIELAFDPLQSVLPHVRAGKLKVIAISSAEASPVLPQVPTFAQAGVKVESTAWWGLFAPAGTPRPIVDRLAAELQGAEQSGDVRQLESIGLTLRQIAQPAALDAFLAAESTKWAKAVRASGAKVD